MHGSFKPDQVVSQTLTSPMTEAALSPTMKVPLPVEVTLQTHAPFLFAEGPHSSFHGNLMLMGFLEDYLI